MNKQMVGATRCGVVAALWLAMAATTVACSADGSLPTGATLDAVDDSNVSTSEISASYPIGTTVAATANLNIRTGPSTGYHVIVVMPEGSRAVTVDQTTPENGFYKIRYGSTVGYSSGAFLRIVASGSTGGSDPGAPSGGSTNVDLYNVIHRAAAGVGFAYWWGHGSWLDEGPTSSTQGVCNGSCPSCSHSGQYGADCSGFVAKAWMVPSSNTALSDDEHPYDTASFRNTTGGGQWSRIDRSTARRGDALVYNNGSTGHVFLIDSPDPWGQMWTYEAPGCASGGGRVHHVIRTATDAYVAIRRNGL